jgi:uncharacterized protein YjgD (DUF1641 family)
MAEPIDYIPSGTTTGLDGSRTEPKRFEELLVATRYGGADALAVILERIDSNVGRAAITRIAKLTMLGGSYTPLLVERLARGIQATSASVASSKVPTWRELARQLRLPSTRRGIAAALALLRALGGEEF